MDINKETKVRFWSKVNKTATCWLWKAGTDKDGYGRIKITKKNRMAHRIAWIVCYGSIPNGLLVLHHCDNPPCCNPKHLFLGTEKANSQDMLSKGRQSKVGNRAHNRGVQAGSNHHNSLLQEWEVMLIRIYCQRGKESQRAIGTRFGITNQHVSGIKRRRIWRHI